MYKATKHILKDYFTCWTPGFIVSGFSNFGFDFCIVENYVGPINIKYIYVNSLISSNGCNQSVDGKGLDYDTLSFVFTV